MAGSREAEKRALIAELAVARHGLSVAAGDLRAAGERLQDSLNLPARAKRSFAAHKGVWLGGSALAGFLLSRLPARKKIVYLERATGQKIGLAAKVGLLWPAIKFASRFAAPLLTKMLAARFGDFAGRFVPGNDSVDGQG